jgi:hypothetical protein
LQALFLTEGQAFGPIVGNTEQTEAFEQLLNPGRSAVFRKAKEVGVKLQVLPDGEFAIKRERLRHVADAFSCRHITRVEVAAKE